MRSPPYLCSSCIRASRQICALKIASPLLRPSTYTTAASHPDCPGTEDADEHDDSTITSDAAPSDQGAMSRRLQDATEEALLTGGRSGQRAVEEAGFDADFKTRLLEKVATAQFNASITDVPEGGQSRNSTRVTGQAWMGQEHVSDAVLRMLVDKHKPLAPGLRGKKHGMPPVDMRIRKETAVSAPVKVASARERASAYRRIGVKNGEDLNDKDKEERRRLFKERFQPGARAMPNTISGLAALANERIEDAIARGQFKNIPRGKGIERDTRADNPFIDTTEYIMNKMIKRQEIVPPWIEKQQELLKAANVFRSRLRNEWKRHAARIISSQGGSLQEQTKRAVGYARAEAVHNPRGRPVEHMAVSSHSIDDVVMVNMRPAPASETVPAEDAPDTPAAPLRDPAWEATERSYMELAIADLNAITRSYNLMAPELAKKPYFSLDRELRSCFADAAPQLADLVRERASRPSGPRMETVGHPGGILDRFGRHSRSVRVHESRAPRYGFREMWRDLWRRRP